jgi:hypothetical protein
VCAKQINNFMFRGGLEGQERERERIRKKIKSCMSIIANPRKLQDISQYVLQLLKSLLRGVTSQMGMSY